MKTIHDAIEYLRDEHERVVVFTQNESAIWEWIRTAKGRFTVGIDPLFWNVPEGTHYGELRTGIKYSVINESPDVGLDVDGKKVMFTASPMTNLLEGDGVVKDTFSFPKIVVSEDITPLSIINKAEAPISIKMASSEAMIKLHEFLSINRLPHSIDDDPEQLPIHIFSKWRKTKNDSVFIDGDFFLDDLFHLFRKKVIISNKDILFQPNRSHLKTIMNVFNDFPESCLDENFISFKTSIPKHKVLCHLDILRRSGSIRRATHVNDSITITNETIIPKGTWSIKSIMAKTGIKRERLIEYLDSVGAKYAYVPSKTMTVYIQTGKHDEAYVDETLRKIGGENYFFTSLVNDGASFINSTIEQKIQNHCLANKTKAVILSGQKSTEINLSQQSA